MRAGDRESFETWARSRQQGLVRNAFLLTGDFQRAEDLVQEALIKAAMRWDSLESGNPDAWARTVIYRQHVSWWRRLRRESVVEHFPDRPNEATGETAALLRIAMSRLTPKQRAVVVLRYIEDLSVADTADALGVSAGTVKKQCSLALERLRGASPELTELQGDRP